MKVVILSALALLTQSLRTSRSSDHLQRHNEGNDTKIDPADAAAGFIFLANTDDDLALDRTEFLNGYETFNQG